MFHRDGIISPVSAAEFSLKILLGVTLTSVEILTKYYIFNADMFYSRYDCTHNSYNDWGLPF